MVRLSLLKSKFKETFNETIGLNSQNGDDAERLAASKLILAIGGELSWGSRNVDGRKIDIICSYDHPWAYKERIFFLVQVKSGDQYGTVLEKGFKLKAAAKSAAKRTSHPICIIWIDRKSNHCFWSYIHPKTHNGSQNYSSNHILTPAFRYDIARCQCEFLPIKRGGKGIILGQGSKNLTILRAFAKEKYTSYKTENVVNPHLGKIEITRIGWRHMFRKKRSRKNKEKSLITICYIDKILTDLASEIFVSRSEHLIEEKSEGRYCEYVLKYNDVKSHTNDKVSVVFRIIEEIRWPSSWDNCSVLTQFVDRRVTLLSCYYK